MKSKTMVGIVIFVVVLIGVYFGYQKLSENYQSPQAGANTQNTAQAQKTAAPDFVVYDAEGKEVKLSDFKGKPVLINFWASWCPPCQGEMPDFQAEYLKEKDNVVFLMVDLTDGKRETRQTAQQFLTEKNYTFPVYFDEKASAANAYQISSIPTTVLVDAEGNLLKRHIGSVSEETLQAYLALLKQ